jgi:hypothetical protein
VNRDDYLAMLATEPATGTQVGAVIGEFERLGVVDRGERLAITAELLGLEHVSSTTDLVMGDAGRLVAMLRRTRDRAELPDISAPADDEDQADEPAEIDDDDPGAERIRWPEAISRIIAMLYAAIWGKESVGKSAEYSAANIDLTSGEGDILDDRS